MDMKAMMRQAQQMQAKIAKAQEEIQELSYEGSAGGGMVSATVKGDGHVESITINPIVVDPEDIEMLQDLVVAAVNDGFDGLAELSAARMNEATGGMKIPGM